MASKTPNQADAFDLAIKCIEVLTSDERIALMKHISASLGGPRFFTSSEVEKMMAQVIEQAKNREAVNLAAARREMWELRRKERN